MVIDVNQKNGEGCATWLSPKSRTLFGSPLRCVWSMSNTVLTVLLTDKSTIEIGNIVQTLPLRSPNQTTNASVLTRPIRAPIIVPKLSIQLHYNRIIGKCSDLRLAAKSVSTGDYSRELVVKSKDEIGEAVMAFNHMTSALREVQDSRNRLRCQLLKMN